MLVSRRKRKEQKEIKIFLNYKPLEQVNKMKYLGIILDNKFKFTNHVNYAAERCTKLIHSLAKSTKISWGLTHEALKSVYKGAVLPLLLYGVPVWLKYTRVQLINIRIAKAYRTKSSEVLRTLTGLTPVTIKRTEVAHLYDIIKGRQTWNYPIDSRVRQQNWLHPAYSIEIREPSGIPPTLQIFTYRNKREHGVGLGVAIFMENERVRELKLKLDAKCSNNQAEQLAIIKGLEAVKDIEMMEDTPRTAKIYTDTHNHKLHHEQQQP